MAGPAVGCGAGQEAPAAVAGGGDPVHSFETLLAHLATQTHNTGRLQKQGPESLADRTVEEVTEPTALQARAAELVELFPVDRSPS